MPVSGTAITVTLVGSVFAYSAVKNITISKTIHSFLSGKVPAGGFMAGMPQPGSVGGGNSQAQYFITNALKLGMRASTVAGFAGNFQLESSFDTTSYNTREGALGWAQWEKGRYDGLQSFAAARGKSATDPEVQFQWWWREVTGAYAYVVLQCAATSNPQTAAYIIDKEYEGSAMTQTAEKQAAAQSFYEEIMSGRHAFPQRTRTS